MNYTFKPHPVLEKVISLMHGDHEVCSIHLSHPYIVFVAHKYISPKKRKQLNLPEMSCHDCRIPLPEHIITQIKLLV